MPHRRRGGLLNSNLKMEEGFESYLFESSIDTDLEKLTEQL